MGSDTQYLIGVDIGTSVIKSLLVDLDGNEKCVASLPNMIQSPRPGWGEQDMLRVWEDTKSTVARVVRESGILPEQVLAIGITGQGEGTWLIGHDGNPVRPAILWLDGRTSEIVSRWHEGGRSPEFFKYTGTVITQSNQLAQLHWLSRAEPEVRQKTRAVVYAKDWIFFKLTGEIFTDESDPSHTCFDIARRVYSEPLFELLEVPEWRSTMPEVRPSYANVSSLLPSVAVEIGLRPGTPVVGGPFDVCASAIGVGCVENGASSLILGTAGINQMVMSEPLTKPADVGHTVCLGPKGLWMRVFPTMTGTVSLEWFVREFCAADIAEAERRGVEHWTVLEERMAMVPRGAGGILYHPYIDQAGERVPFVKPTARAQFLGLNSQHTRHYLLRAIYEGVAFSCRDCFSYMPLEVTEVRLAGGGAKSPFWAQILADVIGKRMVVMHGAEFGAKGAAINAAVAVESFASFGEGVDRFARVIGSFEPDMSGHAVYEEVFKVFRNGYRAVWNLWDELATL